VIVRTLARASLAILASVPALAAEAQEQEPSIFAGNLGNVIVTLIIFGLVIAVLGKLAWRPLLTVLNERERSIRESLETARRERQAAEEVMARYSAQLEKAREEAGAIVEEGRRDGEAVRRRIHEEARGQANEIIERARREIRLATDAALKELYDHTADLAVKLAGGIIRKELSVEDHRRLVAESLDRMRAAARTKVSQ
jgi:F-type H+-transporting ATPase subunit b